MGETAQAAGGAASARPAVRPSAAPLFAGLDSAISDPALLPSAADAVRAERFVPGTNGRLIILLRDAHANLSAQKNLFKAAEFWARETGIDLSLSEAAWGEAGLADARGVLPPAALKRASNRLLGENLNTRHEYLTLVSKLPVRIVGVEDPKLYRRNWEVFRRMTLGRHKVGASLTRSRAVVDGMKRRDYPKELIGYEASVSDADDWIKKYRAVQNLAARAGVQPDASVSEALKAFEALEALEKKIDHDRLAVEQERALGEARAQCGDCADELIDTFKKAGPSVAALLSAIGRLARAAGRESWESSTELGRYQRYLEAVESIDPAALFEAVDALEQNLYDQLAGSRDGRVTRFIDRHTRLLESAYSLRLTPEESRRLNSELRRVRPVSWQAELNDRLIGQDRAEDILAYEPELASRLVAVRNFYRLAALRDHVFARRSDEILTESGKKSAILITGGYHTDHLTELFAKRGYSIAVFTPFVTAETDPAAYERTVLTSDPHEPVFAQPSGSAESTLLAPLVRTPAGAARLASASPRLTGDAKRLSESLQYFSISAARMAAQPVRDSGQDIEQNGSDLSLTASGPVGKERPDPSVSDMFSQINPRTKIDDDARKSAMRHLVPLLRSHHKIKELMLKWFDPVIRFRVRSKSSDDLWIAAIHALGPLVQSDLDLQAAFFKFLTDERVGSDIKREIADIFLFSGNYDNESQAVGWIQRYPGIHARNHLRMLSYGKGPAGRSKAWTDSAQQPAATPEHHQWLAFLHAKPHADYLFAVKEWEAGDDRIRLPRSEDPSPNRATILKYPPIHDFSKARQLGRSLILPDDEGGGGWILKLARPDESEQDLNTEAVLYNRTYHEWDPQTRLIDLVIPEVAQNRLYFFESKQPRRFLAYHVGDLKAFTGYPINWEIKSPNDLIVRLRGIIVRLGRLAAPAEGDGWGYEGLTELYHDLGSRRKFDLGASPVGTVDNYPESIAFANARDHGLLADLSPDHMRRIDPDHLKAADLALIVRNQAFQLALIAGALADANHLDREGLAQALEAIADGLTQTYGASGADWKNHLPLPLESAADEINYAFFHPQRTRGFDLGFDNGPISAPSLAAFAEAVSLAVVTTLVARSATARMAEKSNWIERSFELDLQTRRRPEDEKGEVSDRKSAVRMAIAPQDFRDRYIEHSGDVGRIAAAIGRSESTVWRLIRTFKVKSDPQVRQMLLTKKGADVEDRDRLLYVRRLDLEVIKRRLGIEGPEQSWDRITTDLNRLGFTTSSGKPLTTHPRSRAGEQRKGAEQYFYAEELYRRGLKDLRSGMTGRAALAKDVGMSVEDLMEELFNQLSPSQEALVRLYYGIGVQRATHYPEMIALLKKRGFDSPPTSHATVSAIDQARTILKKHKDGWDHLAERAGISAAAAQDRTGRLTDEEGACIKMKYGIGINRVGNDLLIAEYLGFRSRKTTDARIRSAVLKLAVDEKSWAAAQQSQAEEEAARRGRSRIVGSSDTAWTPIATSASTASEKIGRRSGKKKDALEGPIQEDVWRALRPIERAVMEMAYGIDREEVRSPKKIGQMLRQEGVWRREMNAPAAGRLRRSALAQIKEGMTGVKRLSDQTGVPESLLVELMRQALSEDQALVLKFTFGIEMLTVEPDAEIARHLNEHFASEKYTPQQVRDLRRGAIHRLRVHAVDQGYADASILIKRNKVYENRTVKPLIYTRERMVQIIRMIPQKNVAAVKDAGLGGLVNAVTREFRSWDSFLRIAGYDPDQVRLKGDVRVTLSDEEIEAYKRSIDWKNYTTGIHLLDRILNRVGWVDEKNEDYRRLAELLTEFRTGSKGEKSEERVPEPQAAPPTEAPAPSMEQVEAVEDMQAHLMGRADVKNEGSHGELDEAQAAALRILVMEMPAFKESGPIADRDSGFFKVLSDLLGEAPALADMDPDLRASFARILAGMTPAQLAALAVTTCAFETSDAAHLVLKSPLRVAALGRQERDNLVGDLAGILTTSRRVLGNQAGMKSLLQTSDLYEVLSMSLSAAYYLDPPLDPAVLDELDVFFNAIPAEMLIVPSEGSEEAGAARKDRGGADPDAIRQYMRSLRDVVYLTNLGHIVYRLRSIRGDGRAREAQIKSFLPMVVSKARRWTWSSLDLLDIINEGNIGLMYAVDHWKPFHGAPLVAFVVMTVPGFIQRGVRTKARLIRIPAGLWTEIKHFMAAAEECGIQDAADPDLLDAELAKRFADQGLTNWSVKRISRIRKAISTGPVTSMQRPIGEDGDAEFGDLIGEEDKGFDFEAFPYPGGVDQLLVDLKVSLKKSGERNIERNISIFVERFLQGKTLEEISGPLGLTRERVRQIVDRDMLPAIRMMMLTKFRNSEDSDTYDKLLGAIRTAKTAARMAEAEQGLKEPHWTDRIPQRRVKAYRRLARKIADRIERERPIAVFIDAPSGLGKTTLATAVQEELRSRDLDSERIGLDLFMKADKTRKAANDKVLREGGIRLDEFKNVWRVRTLNRFFDEVFDYLAAAPDGVGPDQKLVRIRAFIRKYDELDKKWLKHNPHIRPDILKAFTPLTVPLKRRLLIVEGKYVGNIPALKRYSDRVLYVRMVGSPYRAKTQFLQRYRQTMSAEELEAREKLYDNYFLPSFDDYAARTDKLVDGFAQVTSSNGDHWDFKDRAGARMAEGKKISDPFRRMYHGLMWQRGLTPEQRSMVRQKAHMLVEVLLEGRPNEERKRVEEVLVERIRVVDWLSAALGMRGNWYQRTVCLLTAVAVSLSPIFKNLNPVLFAIGWISIGLGLEVLSMIAAHVFDDPGKVMRWNYLWAPIIYTVVYIFHKQEITKSVDFAGAVPTRGPIRGWIVPGMKMPLSGTVTHEMIHMLYRLGYITVENPVASAFGELDQFVDHGSSRYADFVDAIHYFEGPLDVRRRWSLMVRRFGDGESPETWRSIPERGGEKANPWTYGMGSALAGIAFAISRHSGRSEDAWKYLALIAHGANPVDAELQILGDQARVVGTYVMISAARMAAARDPGIENYLRKFWNDLESVPDMTAHKMNWVTDPEGFGAIIGEYPNQRAERAATALNAILAAAARWIDEEEKSVFASLTEESKEQFYRRLGEELRDKWSRSGFASDYVLGYLSPYFTELMQKIVSPDQFARRCARAEALAYGEDEEALHAVVSRGLSLSNHLRQTGPHLELLRVRSKPLLDHLSIGYEEMNDRDEKRMGDRATNPEGRYLYSNLDNEFLYRLIRRFLTLWERNEKAIAAAGKVLTHNREHPAVHPTVHAALLRGFQSMADPLLNRPSTFFEPEDFLFNSDLTEGMTDLTVVFAPLSKNVEYASRRWGLTVPSKGIRDWKAYRNLLRLKADTVGLSRETRRIFERVPGADGKPIPSKRVIEILRAAQRASNEISAISDDRIRPLTMSTYSNAPEKVRRPYAHLVGSMTSFPFSELHSASRESPMHTRTRAIHYGGPAAEDIDWLIRFLEEKSARGSKNSPQQAARMASEESQKDVPAVVQIVRQFWNDPKIDVLTFRVPDPQEQRPAFGEPFADGAYDVGLLTGSDLIGSYGKKQTVTLSGRFPMPDGGAARDAYVAGRSGSWTRPQVDMRLHGQIQRVTWSRKDGGAELVIWAAGLGRPFDLLYWSPPTPKFEKSRLYRRDKDSVKPVLRELKEWSVRASRDPLTGPLVFRNKKPGEKTSGHFGRFEDGSLDIAGWYAFNKRFSYRSSRPSKKFYWRIDNFKPVMQALFADSKGLKILEEPGSFATERPVQIELNRDPRDPGRYVILSEGVDPSGGSSLTVIEMVRGSDGIRFRPLETYRTPGEIAAVRTLWKFYTDPDQKQLTFGAADLGAVFGKGKWIVTYDDAGIGYLKSAFAFPDLRTVGSSKDPSAKELNVRFVHHPDRPILSCQWVKGTPSGDPAGMTFMIHGISPLSGTVVRMAWTWDRILGRLNRIDLPSENPDLGRLFYDRVYGPLEKVWDLSVKLLAYDASGGRDRDFKFLKKYINLTTTSILATHQWPLPDGSIGSFEAGSAFRPIKIPFNSRISRLVVISSVTEAGLAYDFRFEFVSPKDLLHTIVQTWTLSPQKDGYWTLSCPQYLDHPRATLTLRPPEPRHH